MQSNKINYIGFVWSLENLEKVKKLEKKFHTQKSLKKNVKFSLCLTHNNLKCP